MVRPPHTLLLGVRNPQYHFFGFNTFFEGYSPLLHQVFMGPTVSCSTGNEGKTPNLGECRTSFWGGIRREWYDIPILSFWGIWNPKPERGGLRDPLYPLFGEEGDGTTSPYPPFEGYGTPSPKGEGYGTPCTPFLGRKGMVRPPHTLLLGTQNPQYHFFGFNTFLKGTVPSSIKSLWGLRSPAPPDTKEKLRT